jgi:predicted DNA-binding transcriptional regulator AlpA
MGSVNDTVERLLNERDVAFIIGLSVASVRRWRALNEGPKYIKIGWSVRYKLHDLLAWLESRPSGGGTQ